MFGRDSTYETVLLIALAAKSNLPLSEAIRLTVGNEPGRVSRRTAASLVELAEQIDRGVPPGEAVFQVGLPNSCAELLESAFEGGDFAGSLEEISRLESARAATFSVMRQALFYPTLLLLFLLALLILFANFMVPSMAEIFQDFGTELPTLTMLVLWVGTALAGWKLWAVLAAWLGLSWLALRFIAPRFLYDIPFLGPMFRGLFTYGLLSQLAFLVDRGKPLDEAFRLCGKSLRSLVYRADCFKAAEEARSGRTLTEIVLRFPYLFPVWIAPLIQASLANNRKVSAVLRRAATAVEEQRQINLLFFQSIITPILFLLFMVCIGLSVVAMFMPLIKLITTLSA